MIHNNEKDTHAVAQFMKTGPQLLWAQFTFSALFLGLILWFFQPWNWLLFHEQEYKTDYVSTCQAHGDFEGAVRSLSSEISLFEKLKLEEQNSPIKDLMRIESIDLTITGLEENKERLLNLGDAAFCEQRFLEKRFWGATKKESQVREKANAATSN